jgi:hypothetical protein
LQCAFKTGALAASPQWTDISGKLLSFQTSRGRPNVFSSFNTGAMSLTLDNRDGYFDPTYTNSPAYPNVVPRKRIRLLATYSAVNYPIFDGFVQSWGSDYTQGEETVTVTCADAFLLLNGAGYPTPLAGIVQESSDARISRVLAAAATNLPTSLDAGLSQIVAVPAPTALPVSVTPGVITANYNTTTSALNMCQQVEQSEYGAFFVARDGTITFQNRYHRAQTGTSTSVQATLDDSNIANPEYMTLTPVTDDQQLYNEAIITDAMGVTYQVDDTGSQANQGIASWQNTTLVPTPNEGYDQAQWIVQTSAAALTRFDAVAIQPVFNSTVSWPALLPLEISYRVQVIKHPPSGNVINLQGYVEQINHQTSPGMDDWQVTLGISPIKLTSFANQFLLNDATHGKLNSSVSLLTY